MLQGGFMNVRYSDKKCQNCLRCNHFNDTCNNKLSDNYKDSIKNIKVCNKFQPNSVCLSCYFYRSDSRRCSNKKSQYYNRYVYDKYLKCCSHRYDAGFVFSQISDILKKDKKQSYSLLLYKLKKELLAYDQKYNECVDFYLNNGFIMASAINFDEEKESYALFLYNNYLKEILLGIKDEKYLEAFEMFKELLTNINDRYNLFDDYEYVMKKF